MSFEELNESKLGRQEYWEDLYKTEVDNFRSHGDVGEVWFGESISKRIVKWMNQHVSKSSHVLDVGCGNGMLLIDLSDEGFINLSGVDYSEDAIILAKEISAQYKANINYAVNDLLKSRLAENWYDVILDKGTYDAISLTSEAKSNRKTYITNVYGCLKEGGLLVLTSCNWSKEELISQFEVFFKVSDVIPTPQLQFGGKVGNTVTSIVFKKL